MEPLIQQPSRRAEGNHLSNLLKVNLGFDRDGPRMERIEVGPERGAA